MKARVHMFSPSPPWLKSTCYIVSTKAFSSVICVREGTETHFHEMCCICCFCILWYFYVSLLFLFTSLCEHVSLYEADGHNKANDAFKDGWLWLSCSVLTSTQSCWVTRRETGQMLFYLHLCRFDLNSEQRVLICLQPHRDLRRLHEHTFTP